MFGAAFVILFAINMVKGQDPISFPGGGGGGGCIPDYVCCSPYNVTCVEATNLTVWGTLKKGTSCD